MAANLYPKANNPLEAHPNPSNLRTGVLGVSTDSVIAAQVLGAQVLAAAQVLGTAKRSYRAAGSICAILTIIGSNWRELAPA
jgi:hypothetical protein